MITLENESIKVSMYEPGKEYRGSRFSQTAFLCSVKYRGVELCGLEAPVPGEGNGGAGLCGEFGIFTPPGFDTCAVGEYFVKPGVGLLKKHSGTYHFYEEFECKPDRIGVSVREDRGCFRTEAQTAGGFGLRADKEVRLCGDSIVIVYDLLNTGRNPIETEEYCHNFIRIGEGAVDSDYWIDTGAVPSGEDGIPLVSEQFAVQGGRLTPVGEISQVHYARLDVAPDRPYCFRITNRRAERFIEEQDSFIPEFAAVWGKREVISVEAFHKISLAPGGRERYTRTYLLGEVSL